MYNFFLWSITVDRLSFRLGLVLDDTVKTQERDGHNA